MLIAIVDSVENKINFTLHIISSHSSFRLILLCQVKPSRRRVLMVRVIIHAAMWNSREDTAKCVQQLLLYGLVHKIDSVTLLKWNKTEKGAETARISDKLTQQPTLNILTRLGETDLCTAWGICGLAQRLSSASLTPSLFAWTVLSIYCLSVH